MSNLVADHEISLITPDLAMACEQLVVVRQGKEKPCIFETDRLRGIHQKAAITIDLFTNCELDHVSFASALLEGLCTVKQSLFWANFDIDIVANCSPPRSCTRCC